MRVGFALIFILIQVVSIESDGTSILAEYETAKSNFESSLTTMIDKFVLTLLDRVVTYEIGQNYLKTKIIDHLWRLDGKNIWAGRKLFEIHENTRKIIVNYFNFSSLRGSFENFEVIQAEVAVKLTEKVSEFLASTNDDIVLDSCWTASVDDVQLVFDDFYSDLDTIFSQGYANFDVKIRAIEAERLTNLKKHESVFKRVGYSWKRIFKYVRHFECRNIL
jgi:hypothetical protein